MTLLSKILGIYKIVTPTIERKITLPSTSKDSLEQNTIEIPDLKAAEPIIEKSSEIQLDNIRLQDATDIF
jgi:hypothetical protein